MSDPLGFISKVGARHLAGGAGPLTPGKSGDVATAGGASFKDVLLKNIDEVNKLQQDMNRAIEDLAAGRRTDVENVILATQKADTAFKALQAVRNRVIEAYDELKQVRV